MIFAIFLCQLIIFYFMVNCYFCFLPSQPIIFEEKNTKMKLVEKPQYL